MIYEQITKFMHIHKINASEFCRQTGINRSTLEGWKNGRQPPSDKIPIICEALKITPNELYGYKNIELTQNEDELLQAFRKLTEREQIKQIGVLENVVNNRNA